MAVAHAMGARVTAVANDPARTALAVRPGADLIVEDNVIVEIKSVEAIAPVHKKQLLTHLRLADKRLGLLIDFIVASIKDGITHIANGMPDRSHAKTPRRKEVFADLRHPRFFARDQYTRRSEAEHR